MAPSVFVFVPAYGRMITASTFEATHALMPRLHGAGIACQVGTMSHPDIAEVRNMILSMWYFETKHSHLLFVDADMGFPPELVLDMLAFNEPLVGAIYRKKDFNPVWVASGLGEDAGAPEVRGGYIELGGLGMGCTLIRRDAVDEMIPVFPDLVMSTEKLDLRGLMHPCPPKFLKFFSKMDMGERGEMSEDLSFCERYRQAGGRVWGATHFSLTHEGPAPFSGSYAQFCAEQARKTDISHSMSYGVPGENPSA